MIEQRTGPVHDEWGQAKGRARTTRVHHTRKEGQTHWEAVRIMIQPGTVSMVDAEIETITVDARAGFMAIGHGYLRREHAADSVPVWIGAPDEKGWLPDGVTASLYLRGSELVLGIVMSADAPACVFRVTLGELIVDVEENSERQATT